MLNFLNKIKDSLTRQPLESILPKLFDPGDPRVAIRPLGDDWLCPLDGQRVLCPDWDGSSLTLLKSAAVMSYLRQNQALQRQGSRARLLPWERLLELTVMQRLLQAPNHKISSARGEWVCPYCLTVTSVLLHQWDNSEAEPKLYIPEMMRHLASCRPYQTDPLGAKPLEEVSKSRGQRAIRIELFKRVCDDPLFQVFDDSGTWICPFSQRAIEAIDRTVVSWGPALQQRITEYLLSPDCPARYSQYKTSVTLAEMQRIAGRSGASKIVARQKQMAEQELQRLQQRVENLSPTAAAVTAHHADIHSARQERDEMMPQSAPEIEGYLIALFRQSSSEQNGDLHQFYSSEAGKTGFLLADVSSKGAEAAVIMSMTLKSFRERTAGIQSPLAVLKAVNDDLLSDISRGCHVSAFYGILEHDSGRFCCARAGHPPPILIDPESKQLRLLEGKGVPLGVGTTANLAQRSQEFETIVPPGNVVLLFSDGVTEVLSPRQERFGEERLYDAVRRGASLAPQELIQHIVTTLQLFVGTKTIEDDMSLIAIKRLSLSW